MLQKQDTSLDAALRVAHAVWHFAGALLGAAPKKRALTRSLRDLTPVREMSQGNSGVPSDVCQFLAEPGRMPGNQGGEPDDASADAKIVIGHVLEIAVGNASPTCRDDLVALRKEWAQLAHSCVSLGTQRITAAVGIFAH